MIGFGEPSLIAFSGTRELDVSEGSEARRIIEMEVARLVAHATVIHGASGNVDALVDALARKRGLTVDPYPADWKKYKKQAGPIRNSKLAGFRPGRWVIVWDGKSPGSLDALKKARRVQNCELVEHVVA